MSTQSKIIRQRLELEIDTGYTPAMRRIEKETGRSLYELLAPHKTSREIKGELGIPQSTVTKYRRILGIESIFKGRPKRG